MAGQTSQIAGRGWSRAARSDGLGAAGYQGSSPSSAPLSESEGMSQVLAAADIGTNSVHMVVARVDADRFEVVEREREMVRLGSSGRGMKALTPSAMNRGIEVLRRFRQVAEIHGAGLRAVATSAVREAENRATFIERARAEAGGGGGGISRFEGARVLHLGVLQAVPGVGRAGRLCGP